MDHVRYSGNLFHQIIASFFVGYKKQSPVVGWALPCRLLWPQYWIYRYQLIPTSAFFVVLACSVFESGNLLSVHNFFVTDAHYTWVPQVIMLSFVDITWTLTSLRLETQPAAGESFSRECGWSFILQLNWCSLSSADILLLFLCSVSGRISLDALDEARKSFGTDEDILLVRFLLYVHYASNLVNRNQ